MIKTPPNETGSGHGLIVPCRVCQSETGPIGAIEGRYVKRQFSFRRCRACNFVFVVNPIIDFAQIYDEAYYHGQGADPLVRYMDELLNPTRSVRRFEWAGVLKALHHLAAPLENKRWLDIGCGNGGLVKYAVERGLMCQGAEDGWIADKARTEFGIPIMPLSELANLTESYDIVTAVEVLEHIEEPLDFLRTVQTLLKPGGLFWYTTGNSAPFQDAFLSWRYVLPEVHLSYFNPKSMEIALDKCGFEPVPQGSSLAGIDYCIFFKVLKTLKIFRLPAMGGFMGTLAGLLGAPIIRAGAKIVDKKYQISLMPMGRRK